MGLVTEAVVDAYGAHISRAQARLFRLLGAPVEVRGDGAIVTAADGREFLDFGSYGVFLLGHRPERVVERVTAAIDRMPTSTRVLPSEETAGAAAALAGTFDGRLAKVCFTSTGAEAVELAMKAAVATTGRGRFVALTGAFHGKSLAALSLTHAAVYRERCAGALLPTDHVAPGDDAALDAALATGQVAAVFAEPIQAEGGVREIDPAWLTRVADAAHAARALFVVDEISTGCGRTGAVWASERRGLVDHADLLLAGKALGGGVLPIGAVVGTAEAFEPLETNPLFHTSTFAGHPAACAAAAATLESLDPDLLARIGALGEEIRARLRRESDWPIAEVRGDGLLIGVEFVSPEACGYVANELFNNGVLVVPALSSLSTLRITPPAVTTPQQVDRFMSVLAAALAEARNVRDLIELPEEPVCPV